MNVFNMFPMENNNNNNNNNNNTMNNDNNAKNGDLVNTNARDSFSTFFDTMGGNGNNNNNNNNNNPSEFVSNQSPGMNMGSPFEQNNNNNNNSMMDALSPQDGMMQNNQRQPQMNMGNNQSNPNQLSPTTPQQILLFNNNNANNNNNNNSSNNMNFQPQQILSNQGSPIMPNGSPLNGNNDYGMSQGNINPTVNPTVNPTANPSNNNNNNNNNNNPQFSSNINNNIPQNMNNSPNNPNMRGTNGGNNGGNNNNAFTDRAAMFSSLQQKQQQQRFLALQQQQQQQQQQRMQQRNMNSPIPNNVIPNTVDNPNSNSSPIPRPLSLNTNTNPQGNPNNNNNSNSNNNNNNNMTPSNQFNHLTPQQQLQQQQQKNILQSLSPAAQQKISMEVNNKQYELFMKSLIENSKRRNAPLQSIPEIQTRKVNLFYLSLMVQRLGGCEQVSRQQLWGQIANKLRIADPQQLEAVYYSLLFDYEKYMNTDEGRKESLAKKNFLQQFLHELLRKTHMENVQQNQQQQQQQQQVPPNQGMQAQTQFNDINYQQNKMQNNPNMDPNISLNNSNNISGMGTPNTMNPVNLTGNAMRINSPSVGPCNLNSMTPGSHGSPPSIPGSVAGSTPGTTGVGATKKAPKKPRKPRVKKKTKKELELERKQKEAEELEQKRLLEAQKLQQKLVLEQKIKQRYERELAKLPKVYKRTFIRNYTPKERKIDHVNGYDINYISQIGEKIDSHKPIFLFAPELGTINLHAVSMSLQCNNLGEITTALNTLLVASADVQIKISLNQYPALLNSLAKLAINLLNDLLYLETSNDNKNTLRNKNLSFISNYAEQYDVENYLNTKHSSFSTGNKSIEETFNEFIKSNELDIDNSEPNKVIVVDSLTGYDVDQVPVTTSTLDLEIPSNSDIEATMNERHNCSHKPSDKWALSPKPLRLKFDVDTLNIYVPSYMESLKNVKTEIDSPFSKIHTRGADDTSVLILDQLSTISMILRNISFSDINSNIMSQNYFLKRYFSDLLWLLFTDDKIFKFHRKALNLKKDTVISLANISHHWKMESYTFTVTLVLLIISFGIPKRTEDKDSNLTFEEYSLKISKYQSFGVDTLAKLLSIAHPNKDYFRTVLLNDFDNKDITVNEDVKIAKKLVAKYNEKGDLFNDLICYLFSIIPFQQLSAQPSIVEDVSPVISQSLTALYHLILLVIENNDDKENKTENYTLRWLTSIENLGLNMKRLYEFYQSLASTKKSSSKTFYNGLSCKIVRLLRLLIKESAVDSDSCKEIVESPYLLPSEAELFRNMTNPVADSSFVHEIGLFLKLRSEILNGT